MNNLTQNKTFGVILVDNIPPQTTDSQLQNYFAEIKDVSAIQFIDGEDADLQRSCWIVVAKPAETVNLINVSTIAGKNPRARLMGYLYTS